MSSFETNEQLTSQVPAIQVLVNMGYIFLPREQETTERQSRRSNVLLETILRDQLKSINHIQYRGNEYLFSEENIQSAIQKLKNVKYDGLLKTNEAIYDLITLGTSLEQTIEGDTKSHTLNFIDWRNPERNVFHVTAEFSVERNRSTETARPDIVLFVNGIPLVVIECKAPNIDVDQGVSQNIRNQTEEYIPKLFTYAQLLLAVNKNEAKYATVGSIAKYWAKWREEGLEEGSDTFEQLNTLINTPIVSDVRTEIEQSVECRIPDSTEPRLVTEQDKVIYSLLRPERLLELVWKFTIFDGGTKKVARYQQYQVIKSTLDRISKRKPDGSREGGVVWHTQGSGKSLSMVMLARNLALDTQFTDPRIVLVSDRDDLDKQLGNTFTSCHLEPQRATSGRNLLELIATRSSSIITTIINKFESAYSASKYQDNSPDIFLLVDEGHRTQFGSFAARMRQMFPRACYLGFTGTPLMKKEKNNFAKFGSLIQPYYSITQAVEDGAVVPLLYEARHVEMTQNQKALDLWFERHTKDLTEEQRADLKRKYARAEMLNKADQVIYTRAFDISEHFRANWQNTGFKAQLVAPNKVSALKYLTYLEELGVVSAAVVMSPPDMREGYEETEQDESNDEVVKFWQKMMKRYGKESEYNKQLINQFKHGTDPEILIVIDKLLTGFDAPRNTVMYLCRMLREHTLLQAIARVNRIFEGKDFGFIVDYVSVLGELDKALTMYDGLDGFEEEDIAGALTNIDAEVSRLPQLYSALWDLFKEIKSTTDEEAFEVFLADDAVREEYYERLAEYSRALALALSSEKFLFSTPETDIKRYKTDLRKFQALKAAVKLRYAEGVDYRDYEPKIKKLLDTHIQASEVIQLHEPVNIFDEEAFNQVKERQGLFESTRSKNAQADIIAHATKKVISEKFDEDPTYFKKFSILIQQAIDDFRAKRIEDLEYLNRVLEIRDKVVRREHDGLPEALAGNDDAAAFYGVIQTAFSTHDLGEEKTSLLSAAAALQIHKIINENWKVQFWDDEDIQNKVINEIDDYLFDEIRSVHGVELTLQEMDEIIEKVLTVARHRHPK
jgi:type I restriction enzyme, R subunit